MKFTLEPVSSETKFSHEENLVIFIQRPMWTEQVAWLANLGKRNLFKIIHCSDEFSQDPIDFYNWSCVRGVLRFYPRQDAPYAFNIPLGYHWQGNGLNPSLEQRPFSWSFIGTNWKNRSKNLEPLAVIPNHEVKYFPDWNDKNQLKDGEYMSLLLNSKFIPCPEGNNTETYRLYEALECGCIPVFTKLPTILLSSKIPFLKTETWEQVAELMQKFLDNPSQMNAYRNTILSAWLAYKSELKLRVEKWTTL